MNKIDTDYKSLSEVPSAVAQFYEEETRERITGYTDEEEPQPIKEPYTVVVLNKPETVLYSFVESRKGRRHPQAVVMAALESAIAWEEFYFNHDLFLAWVADYAKWEEEQPTKEITNENGETESVILPAPIKPVIDLASRREHYLIKEVKADDSIYHILPGFALAYDDDALIASKTYDVKKKTAEELKAETEKVKRNDALNYLLSTDWAAARVAEGGEPMPDDMKAKRAKARDVLNGSYVELDIDSFYP
ncbi:putative DUF4376 domain-containing protein [Vibrio phage 137E35-1]|nr:putative DUF4376 domain-containing protein [Vibrio phage 137E35-1]CAH9015766.1 putative DUF4376 domain-containing protein [Vibrio phage 230E39-1]